MTFLSENVVLVYFMEILLTLNLPRDIFYGKNGEMYDTRLMPTAKAESVEDTFNVDVEVVRHDLEPKAAACLHGAGTNLSCS